MRMGTKFTADALDSPDSDWLSDRADIVNRRLKVTKQIPFRGPNRNEDAINQKLLVVPQLTNPPPNTDPDAFRRRLLTTPYPMTGLRRQGGYEDAGKFGGGHHGGRGRGGFGLRGMRGGFLSPIVADYTEVVEVPICFDSQGRRIPCPPAPNDAYALTKGASALAPRRAYDQTGPAIGRDAGDLSDPQDFVQSARDWQGNPVISTIPMRKFRDESFRFDGRLRNASGFGNAGLLPAGDWKKPYEKPDGRLYIA
ncbi:MAG: hypothetical protein LUO93_04305, partial [Methanomicrobiales archaeon]|nr:hypothetical protein [Methanomicrobiales archaeon]